MYGTSLCLELTYTWDQRGIPDSGQCPVEISSEIDEIFRRLICGYYEWERRTIPRTTLATPSIGAVWTNAFLEMEGEQTCYLKTLTLVRHRGPTTRIIMQVSSRKAKKVQNKKLRQWTTTVTQIPRRAGASIDTLLVTGASIQRHRTGPCVCAWRR